MALNGLAMRYYTDPGFRLGAFTHPDPRLRRAAIDLTKRGLDALAEMGGPIMTLWMGQDGVDYAFQGDYSRMWDHTLEALAEVSDHNPALEPWQTAAPNNVAGKGHIEAPGAGGNIVWQSRSVGPSDYENALGDAFELLFEEGADSPQQMVDGLNRLALRTPDGRAWTLAAFEAELARLGA